MVCRNVCTEAPVMRASFIYFVTMYSIARALIGMLNFEMNRLASSTFGLTFRYDAMTLAGLVVNWHTLDAPPLRRTWALPMLSESLHFRLAAQRRQW